MLWACIFVVRDMQDTKSLKQWAQSNKTAFTTRLYSSHVFCNNPKTGHFSNVFFVTLFGVSTVVCYSLTHLPLGSTLLTYFAITCKQTISFLLFVNLFRGSKVVMSYNTCPDVSIADLRLYWGLYFVIRNSISW